MKEGLMSKINRKQRKEIAALAESEGARVVMRPRALAEDTATSESALLHALDARAIARSVDGEREISIEELITGYYETSLRPNELLVEVRIPPGVGRAVYRKFRSRSSEDRPCVAVAAVQTNGKLRVVVGAVAKRPQYFPDICSLAHSQQLSRELATEIGRRYAESIHPISDARGSAEYRRRVIAVEVRRALEDLLSDRLSEASRENGVGGVHTEGEE